MRVRSPGYPSISIDKAIEIVGKIYSANRTNGIDRDAAVRDMGYSGLTGASGKMLANLLHYGLVEKAGKGGVRVTALAVDILHPADPYARPTAIRQAAFHPALFAELLTKFNDGTPSENAIRSHLMRDGFSDVAVGPAISSFLETCRFVEQASASESKDDSAWAGVESVPEIEERGAVSMTNARREPVIAPSRMDESNAVRTTAAAVPAGSRVVFSEEGGPGEGLQVIAKGEVSEFLLEALEDYVKRQRKRKMME